MQELPFPAGAAGGAQPEHANLRPFLSAVAEQVARHGPALRGTGGAPSASDVHRAAERVGALLTEADVQTARAAEQLLAEPPMLAAFFANLDLLPAPGDPLADRVVAVVMRALEHAGHPG